MSAAPHLPPPAPRVPSSAPTALIIDDSASMRALLRLALGTAGVSVVAEAGTGAQALELYAQHRPSLVLMDIVLPGADGVKVATELLRAHPEAQVVMCSSLTTRERIVACRDAGVAHFILKPFTVEKVAEVARTVLARQAALAGSAA
jgi:two-component system, chemotaxis family, chemotaxis protein CheY